MDMPGEEVPCCNVFQFQGYDSEEPNVGVHTVEVSLASDFRLHSCQVVAIRRKPENMPCHNHRLDFLQATRVFERPLQDPSEQHHGVFLGSWSNHRVMSNHRVPTPQGACLKGKPKKSHSDPQPIPVLCQQQENQDPLIVLVSKSQTPCGVCLKHRQGSSKRVASKTWHGTGDFRRVQGTSTMSPTTPGPAPPRMRGKRPEPERATGNYRSSVHYFHGSC